MDVFVFAFIGAVVIVCGILGWLTAKKRREEMALLAQRLGFRFDSSRDRSIPAQYLFEGR